MKIVGLLYNTKTVASLTFTETSYKSTQGSTLTLTRSPLESNISEWKVKKANEPKILARSGNYF